MKKSGSTKRITQNFTNSKIPKPPKTTRKPRNNIFTSRTLQDFDDFKVTDSIPKVNVVRKSPSLSKVKQ